MKRYLSALTAAMIFFSPAVNSAENAGEVFLSLTRKPESLSSLPVNIAVINRQQLENGKPSEIQNLLSNQSGISVSRIGTAGSETSVMIRGASSAQLLVMIDGRRMNNPASGEASLSMVPLARIERIEIIKGGASAIYGTGASGGVINIITRKPAQEGPSAELKLSAGSFSASDIGVSVMSAKGPLSVFASAGKVLSGGWRENSDYERGDFFGNFTYDGKGAGLYTLTSSFVDKRLGLPGPGALIEEYNGEREKLADTPLARQDDSGTDWKLENMRTWENSSLKTSVYTSEKITDYKDPARPQNQENRAFVFGGETQYSDAYGLTLGVEWWGELYRQKDILTDTVPIDRSRTTTAGYLQKIFSSGAFDFIPSVRFDQNSVFGGVFSPHISITCALSDSLKLSANAGKVWRAPTFDDLYYPLDAYAFEGNPELKPESGIASDIGAEFGLGGAGIKANLFNIQTEDLISWQPVPGSTGWTPQNIGKAVQAGGELEFNQKIVSGLAHRLAYTYLWAEDTDTKALLIYRPRNTLNYILNCSAFLGANFGIEAQYYSERLTGQAAPASLPEYAIYNFTASKKVRDLELWARIDNLTDKRYQTRASYHSDYTPAGFPLPGITYSAGLTVKFWE